jgi:hypothetical protein
MGIHMVPTVFGVMAVLQKGPDVSSLSMMVSVKEEALLRLRTKTPAVPVMWESSVTCQSVVVQMRESVHSVMVAGVKAGLVRLVERTNQTTEVEETIMLNSLLRPMFRSRPMLLFLPTHPHQLLRLYSQLLNRA